MYNKFLFFSCRVIDCTRLSFVKYFSTLFSILLNFSGISVSSFFDPDPYPEVLYFLLIVIDSGCSVTSLCCLILLLIMLGTNIFEGLSNIGLKCKLLCYDLVDFNSADCLTRGIFIIMDLLLGLKRLTSIWGELLLLSVILFRRCPNGWIMREWDGLYRFGLLLFVFSRDRLSNGCLWVS
jgi:hypothetical protein